ncbi:MAG: nucleotidyltransferase family protein [Candidatus Binatia bacterium]
MIPLLRAAYESRRDLPLAAFDEGQIRWAVETGLGPLLFQTTKGHLQSSASPLWPLLQGADLTARILTGDQLDAMSEIIDACEGRVHPLTLLKGISICDQHYPEPHLRPMRDMDFLVEDADLEAVEAILLKLGYRQQSEGPAEFYETHHHSMPLFHPQRGVWVEVHRGLFGSKSRVGADKVFSRENLKNQLRPSEFQGRKVARFSDELQIVYIASHWAQNFQAIGGTIAMLDVIYLWKNTKDKLDWNEIFDWLSGSVASTYLYLLLSYLDKYRLIDISPEILNGLFVRQRSFGKINLNIIHSLIDNYLANGKDFGKLLSLRNCFLLWATLVSPRSPLINLLLIPWKLILPYRLRKRFQSYETKPILELMRLGCGWFLSRTGSVLKYFR